MEVSRPDRPHGPSENGRASSLTAKTDRRLADDLAHLVDRVAPLL